LHLGVESAKFIFQEVFMKAKQFITLVAAMCFLLCGCQISYYKAREAFGGQPKREILVNRVTNVRNAQENTIQQFQYAFEQFGSVLNYQGKNMVGKYKELDSEFKKSRSAARVASRRIESVKNVAEPLFVEWEGEMQKYENETLRKASADLFRKTRARYDQLIETMEKTRDKVFTVLKTFDEQVLFLKHNLNAQATDSLDNKYNFLQVEIEELVQQMKDSIAQADAFIQTMTVPTETETVPE